MVKNHAVDGFFDGKEFVDFISCLDPAISKIAGGHTDKLGTSVPLKILIMLLKGLCVRHKILSGFDINYNTLNNIALQSIK